MRFAVHGPAPRRASSRSHRPPDGDVSDVLCRVHVRVIRVSTGTTAKDRLALTVLRCAVTAGVADLGRVPGVDPDHALGRFLLQADHQQAPARRMNRTVQPCLGPHVRARRIDRSAGRADQILNFQILHCHHGESARQRRGRLLDPVLAPVALTGFQTGDRGLKPSASIRTPLCPGEPALQLPQPLGLPVGQTRNSQQFPCRESGRYGHTTVDADGFFGSGRADGFWHGSEADMPSPRTVAGDAVGLHVLCDGSGPAKPNPANLGDPDLTDLARYPANIPLTAAPDDPKSFVTSSSAPGWTLMGAIEEVVDGLGEVSKRLLLDCLRPGTQPRELCSCVGQLPGLRTVAGRARAAWAPVPVLLHRQIPHESGMRAVLQQRRLLGGCRNKPKPHARTLTNTTDKRGRERRFISGQNAGSFASHER